MKSFIQALGLCLVMVTPVLADANRPIEIAAKGKGIVASQGGYEDPAALRKQATLAAQKAATEHARNICKARGLSYIVGSIAFEPARCTALEHHRLTCELDAAAACGSTSAAGTPYTGTPRAEGTQQSVF